VFSFQRILCSLDAVILVDNATQPMLSAPVAAMKRAAALRKEITAHDRRYYDEDAPTASDAEWRATLRRPT